METIKKLSEMTEEEISQLSNNEILAKSFTETIEEINLDTEYISDSIKHTIGTLVMSLCLLPFISVSYFFLLSFLVPLFLTYVTKRLIDHRNRYISLLMMEHEMYSGTGEFSQEFLDSFLEDIDLTIKL
jgi:hypothetical protein